MMSLTWMVSLTHGMHTSVMILPDLTGPCSAVCPWTRSCSTSVKGKGCRDGPSGPAVISSLSTARHPQPPGASTTSASTAVLGRGRRWRDGSTL